MSLSTSSKVEADDALPRYASLLASYHRAHRDTFSRMIAELPIGPGARILDVPCGDGFYAQLFAERIGRRGVVVAVDALTSFLESAQQDSGSHRVQYVQADVYDLPFDDECFDLAWCAQSLISLSEPRERVGVSRSIDALREIRRVLKPQGVVGVLEHDEMHHVLLPWPMELESKILEALREDFVDRNRNLEQLAFGRHLGKLLSRAGFTPELRSTYATDRQAPLSEEETAYLCTLFASLRRRIKRHVDARTLASFDQYTDPKSPKSFFHQPDFEMTCLDVVRLGRKK